MLMPETHSMKNRSPISLFELRVHGIMGFCHGIVLAANLPVANKLSQKTKHPTRMPPMVIAAITAADLHEYVTPPHVSPRMMSPKPKMNSICPP